MAAAAEAAAPDPPLPRLLEESYTAVIVSRPSDKNETSVLKIRSIFLKKVRGLSGLSVVRWSHVNF